VAKETKKTARPKYTYATVLSKEDRKYFAKKLDVNEEEIINERLYNFIKSWEGTKYVWGGETRNGIDCSALVQQLYSYVYKKELPRTAQEMTLDKRLELFKSDENLREGDFVFFRLNDERIITHVGIYLKNNKFFAANLVGGVEIATLKKPYWKKNFMAAGRFKQ
jgi:cell wall-associated NlpC family hydrolase